MIKHTNTEICNFLPFQRADPPNCMFIMGAEVEGRPFHGEGRNKKDAKKAVALEILKEIHQITYPSNTPKE